MKIITMIFTILINICSLMAQEASCKISVDTVIFDNIFVYNKILNKKFTLYTKIENIINFVDDTKTQARPATGSIVNIPFYSFPDNELFYTVYSEFFSFSYKAWNGDIYINSNDIFIRYIEPNENIVLSITYNNKTIALNQKIKLADLKHIFKQSYIFFENNKKENQWFFLRVIKDNKIAYLDLEFENDNFIGMRLRNKNW